VLFESYSFSELNLRDSALRITSVASYVKKRVAERR